MATQKARSELIELRNIHTEITRLKSLIKGLTEKSDTLTESIHKFLKESNLQSISYGDFKIEAMMKQKRQRKKKAEKEKDVLAVLQKAGIRDAKRLYAEINDSLKGEITTQSSIKVETGPKNESKK
jgi:hypothetical protein